MLHAKACSRPPDPITRTFNEFGAMSGRIRHGVVTRRGRWWGVVVTFRNGVQTLGECEGRSVDGRSIGSDVMNVCIIVEIDIAKWNAIGKG